MLKFLGGGGDQENQKKTGDVGGGGIAMTTADHMDLQALPEGCIANAVSLTTPQDAGMMSSVSRSFRSAEESDAVWDRFLPPDIHTILSSSSPSMSVQPPHVSPSTASKTKKELYRALCDNPVLIEQGKLSFSRDKWRGKGYHIARRRRIGRTYILGFQPRKINEAQYPKERNDGWLEIELGEYLYEGGEGGELEMICLGNQGGHWKGGLIFQGIEIRPKKM